MVDPTRLSDASQKPSVLLLGLLVFGLCMHFSTVAYLHLATWNVRGISKEYAQHQAASDCDRYNLDLIALQETKVSQQSDTLIPGKHRLILFNQKQSWHGGLGFIINRRFIPNVVSYQQISDRVAYLDVCIPSKCQGTPPLKIRVVNCYSPTNVKSVQNPQIADQFYCELQEAVNIPARHELFVMGDFNGRLGKRTNADFDHGLDSNLGRHGVGRRNENGERLLAFMITNGLYAANTAFYHASRHTNTFTGWIKDQRSKKSVPWF